MLHCPIGVGVSGCGVLCSEGQHIQMGSGAGKYIHTQLHFQPVDKKLKFGDFESSLISEQVLNQTEYTHIAMQTHTHTHKHKDLYCHR